MAQEAAGDDDKQPKARFTGLRPKHVIRAIIFLALAAAVYIWVQRVELAQDLIRQNLDDRGIEASYVVESISPSRQVLRDIVIGDPARPDLTVERVEIGLTPRWGLPAVTTLTLLRPRLYGSYREGQLSFGALDPLIFTGDETPFEFPDLRLTVEDGRGLIESDFGPVGLKLAGFGHLRGGFSGELAAIAPQLDMGACEARSASLYGTISIDAERPHFEGPLRFAQVACGDGGMLANGAIDLQLQAERNLADIEGRGNIAIARLELGEMRAGALAGSSNVSWREGALTALYDIEARDLVSPVASLAMLGLDGRLHASQGFARIETEGDANGRGVRLGEAVNEALSGGAQSAEGTMFAPLLAQLRSALARELSASSFAANYTLRSEDGNIALVMPEGALKGRSGASLLALSRAQFAIPADGLPYFDGNLATGGAGLPQISGRMEQAGGGPLELSIRMGEYAAGSSRLALPELRVVQSRGGGLEFRGRAEATGQLSDGFVTGLEVPLDGTYSANGDLALWQGCRDVRFASLQLAGLSLGDEAISLCPQGGGAILQYRDGQIALAAQSGALDLAGSFADAPLNLSAQSISLSYPGDMALQGLSFVMGEAGAQTRLELDRLSASIQGAAMEGDFSGGSLSLPSVPLAMTGLSGNLAMVDGEVELGALSMNVSDVAEQPRYLPLAVRNATMTMRDGSISASGNVSEPYTMRRLAQVSISHDLASASGSADFTVPGIVFDDGLQLSSSDCLARLEGRPISSRPRSPGLTCQFYGAVTLITGVVTGSGRINWSSDDVTSSGTFSSNSLDLAATFGQVSRASGTITFTDLLGMTTPPGQVVKLGTINTGIDLYDGELAFQLIDGEHLELEGASWPFMGGALTMRPLTMNIGVAERRVYGLEIVGLQAARFVEHMELNNLSASGIFDGEIPVIFDESGNGFIEGGILTARAPGGNLAYVGALTYEDLSFMGNYAFQTLRDLQFTHAELLLDGSLGGELVTQVRFEGVGQGQGAKSNIITRQIAKLPIELNVRISAPFANLITLNQTLYDPSSVIDQRRVEQLRAQRASSNILPLPEPTRLPPENPPARQAISQPVNEPDIQPPESEAVP